MSLWMLPLTVTCEKAGTAASSKAGSSKGKNSFLGFILC